MVIRVFYVMATRKPQEEEKALCEGSDRSLAAAKGVGRQNRRHLISNQHRSKCDVH